LWGYLNLSRTVGSGLFNISKSQNFQFWVSEAPPQKNPQNKKTTGFDFFFLKPQRTDGSQRRIYSFTDG
jgi:hypothetical protein